MRRTILPFQIRFLINYMNIDFLPNQRYLNLTETNGHNIGYFLSYVFRNWGLEDVESQFLKIDI